jgi:glycosyltransferase involved in cell wall biosynthesis
MCAGRRVVRIPNCVPLETFHPGRRAAARQRLGFRDDRFYLLAGSAALGNPLKGAQFVAEAAPLLAARHPQVELVLFGRGGQDVAGMPVCRLGFMAAESAMADAYAACDAFVLPTLVDNLPNTLLEAIACGTPCVTFQVGGCPDIVRDGVTGFVAEEQTATALAFALGRVVRLEGAARLALRSACRAVAEQDYAPAIQAHACVTLYREMVR